MPVVVYASCRGCHWSRKTLFSFPDILHIIESYTYLINEALIRQVTYVYNIPETLSKS